MKDNENSTNRTKSADLGVMSYYGNNLLRNVKIIFDHIEAVQEEIGEYNPSERIMESLGQIRIETRLMQIGVNDMLKLLAEFQGKTEPKQEEDEPKLAKQTSFTGIKNIEDLLSRNKTTST